MSETNPRPDAEVPESAADPTLGRTIAGKFAVQRRIGAGAMGVVYLAQQLALDKVVAIKVLHRELAVDPGFIARFRREARAASRLDHPNSIRVFDFGAEPDGLLYIAMEYVEGPDLFSVIHEHGPLPNATIVDLLSQVLSALAVAHDLGVFHRDLKPENIMIVRGKGEEGQPVDVVKVLDFGIAKIAETGVQPADQNARRHTTKGLVVGTPEYMSPEQARGDVLDGRSDLYSVGVILYELLTGRVPFEGDSPISTVLKHISDPPSPPSALSPNVDPQLEAICLKALAKAPSDRFQDAREMRLALRSVSSAAAPAVSTLEAGALLPLAKPTPTPRVHDETKATLAGLTPGLATPPSKRGRTWIVSGLVALGGGALLFASLRGDSRPKVPLDIPTASRMDMTATAVVEREAPPRPVDTPAPPQALPTLSAPVEALRVPDHEKKPHRKRADIASPAAEPATPPPVAVAANEPAAPAVQAPPVEAPAPAPPPPAPPAAAPPAPPTAAEPPPPAYDLAAAHVEIGQAIGTIGVTSSSVTRAISEASAQVTGCYRSALPRLTGPNEGRGMLHVETDGAGFIVNARLAGPMDASIGRCVTSAIQGHRVANVDTGSASAEVPLVFKAH
jgi:serine/threonine-protein kinase